MTPIVIMFDALRTHFKLPKIDSEKIKRRLSSHPIYFDNINLYYSLLNMNVDLKKIEISFRLIYKYASQ